MFYLQILVKTLLSNISPNKNLLSTLYLNFKSFIKNLGFSYKNFNKIPKKIYKTTSSKSIFWTNALTHLRFINYFYNEKDILKAPIIEIVAGGFLRKNNNFSNTQSGLLNKIKKDIVKNYNFLNFNSVYNWLEIYYHGILKFEKAGYSKEKIKNLSILEIGPGIGFNALIYQKMSDKNIFFYDFEEVTDIQKKILNNFDNTIKNISFFNDANLLEKDLIDQEYFVISFWAFSEFNIEDRKKFEKIIKNSKFSIFLSNKNFENIENYNYFNELSKKTNKTIQVVPLKMNNQENFTKTHKYFILY